MHTDNLPSSQAPRRLFLTLALVTVAGGLAGCAGTKTREYIDDSAITGKIKAEFTSDKAVSALHIHVTTTNGHVRLTGTAKSAAEKRRAEQIAHAVEGVRSVTNDITVTGQ